MKLALCALALLLLNCAAAQDDCCFSINKTSRQFMDTYGEKPYTWAQLYLASTTPYSCYDVQLLCTGRARIFHGVNIVSLKTCTTWEIDNWYKLALIRYTRGSRTIQSTPPLTPSYLWAVRMWPSSRRMGLVLWDSMWPGQGSSQAREATTVPISM